MNNNLKTFGEKLKDLRIRAGKSQTEAANEIALQFPNRIRISQTTLSTLEQRTEPPRYEVVQVLAEFFGVPPTYFDPQNTERIEGARAYLEMLRDTDPTGSELFAHSSTLRSGPDDAVGKSLRELRVDESEYGDEDFFDT